MTASDTCTYDNTRKRQRQNGLWYQNTKVAVKTTLAHKHKIVAAA